MSSAPQLILVLSCLSGFVLGILLMIFSKKNSYQVDGLREWTYGLLTLSSAILLLILRNKIPDLFSIVLANTFMLIGFMQINSGLRKFFAVTNIYSKVIPIIFIFAYVLSVTWFTYVDNNFYIRSFIYVIGGLIVLIDIIWILISRIKRSFGVVVLFLTMGLLIVGRLIRLFDLLLNPQQSPSIMGDSNLHLLLLALPNFTIPIATISFFVLAYERLTLRLNELLQKDELTASLNKRSFYEEAQREIRRAIRYKHPTSFLMIDIDNFKSINDQYGHLHGDKILKKIADQIRQTLRTSDLLSRFGGDEFVVILPETKITIAQKIAERIVSSTANDDSIAYTVSIGLSALIDKEDTVDTVLHRADQALYKAKAAGKNCCVIL